MCSYKCWDSGTPFYNTSSLDFLNIKSLQVRWVFWLSETHDTLFLKASIIKKCLLPRPARESLFFICNGNKVWDLTSVPTTPTFVLGERIMSTPFGCQRPIDPILREVLEILPSLPQ